MPNWCLNEVRVYFPDVETRDEFLRAVEGGRKVTMALGGEEIKQMEHTTMLFNSILPEPKHTIEGEGVDQKWIGENGEEYDWYNWRCQNWGTKWEPDIIHFDREDDTTVYWEMYTAWCPPDGIYNKLCEDWEDKDVTINWFYREDGMQIAGWLPE
tara:strand:+ start:2681 stop:3145 length:465 start_codon:yes stop_codon:yes gene_type:complete